jgi:hypothetical protein
MDCLEFQTRYSDLRDGLVTAPRELRRFQRHLALCAACRRYDAALRAGVAAWQEAPPIEPSAAFRDRLAARLAAERSAGVRVPVAARLAAALLVAVAVMLAATETLRRPAPPAAAVLPPVAFPKPVVNAGIPLVTFQDPRAAVVSGNPYAYGTALVQPASTGR